MSIDALDWSLPPRAFMGASVLMILLWIWHLRPRNAGIVDVGWALGLGGTAVYYAWAGEGLVDRRIIVAGLASIWALRLASHLFFRSFWRKPEEGRYVRLRTALGNQAALMFIPFFLVQAVLDVLLSGPFLVAVATPGPLGVRDFAGVALIFGAWVGEAVADRQLARCKRRPEMKGRTCQEGLWRYSRHPNYFFEWLYWCGFAVMGTRGEAAWIAWSAPVLMFVLLNYVTGIPFAEAQSLQNRSDYREYQARTSPFFPWFPRRAEMAAARSDLENDR